MMSIKAFWLSGEWEAPPVTPVYGGAFPRRAPREHYVVGALLPLQGTLLRRMAARLKLRGIQISPAQASLELRGVNMSEVHRVLEYLALTDLDDKEPDALIQMYLEAYRNKRRGMNN